MATLKEMLACWRKHSRDVRAEYDGESWSVWTQADNGAGGYPDFQGLTNEQLKAHLRLWLRSLAEGKERIAVDAGKDAAEIRTASRSSAVLGESLACIDVDGYVDDKGIRYLGKAYRQDNGTYRVMADVHGQLCIVEANIKVG